MSILFNNLSLRYRQALFLRIDADTHPQEKVIYGISIVPTFLFYYYGKEQERITGCDQALLEAKIEQYTQISQRSNYFCDEDGNVEEQREDEHIDTTIFDFYDSSTNSVEEMSPKTSQYSHTSDQDYVPPTLRSSISPVIPVSDMQNQYVTTIQKSPELVMEPATTVLSTPSLSQPTPTSGESVQGTVSQPKPKTHTHLEPIEEILLDLGFSISTISQVLHRVYKQNALSVIGLALTIENGIQYYDDVSDWEIVVLFNRMGNR